MRNAIDSEIDKKKEHQRESSKNKDQKLADLKCCKKEARRVSFALKKMKQANENSKVQRKKKDAKWMETQWSVSKCKSVKA